MARVQKSFSNEYPSIDRKDLHKPIVFVVDMVNGFIKEGAMHDPAILDICPPIVDVMKGNEHNVIFVRDAHPKQTREFLCYPQHCVHGTSESEVIKELQPYVYEEMCKNSTNAFVCPDFQEFLETRIYDYQDFILTGCCSDICIMQFALCLNAWLNEHNEDDKRVIVAMDCIDTYHIDNVHDAFMHNESSIKNMAGNGILVVSHIERRGS